MNERHQVWSKNYLPLKVKYDLKPCYVSFELGRYKDCTFFLINQKKITTVTEEKLMFIRITGVIPGIG